MGPLSYFVLIYPKVKFRNLFVSLGVQLFIHSNGWMKFAQKIALPWATSVSWWHELTVREIRSSYSASYPFQIVSMLVTKKFHYMTFVAIGDNAMPVHVFCTLCSSVVGQK